MSNTANARSEQEGPLRKTCQAAGACVPWILVSATNHSTVVGQLLDTEKPNMTRMKGAQVWQHNATAAPTDTQVAGTAPLQPHLQ